VPGNVRLALVTELDDTQTNIWRLRCIYKIIKSGRCCKITPYILYFALRVALHYGAIQNRSRRFCRISSQALVVN